MKRYRIAKMAGQSTDTIEALEEILESLRIAKNNMLNRSTKPATPKTDEMLIAPAPVVYNENILTKTMVPDPG